MVNAMDNKIYATGKRKRAVARVWIAPGDGQIVVNKMPVSDYFGRDTNVMKLRQPLELVERDERYDVLVNVNGGGATGQAGAIRHGIARALALAEPDLRTPLKRAGMLMRDARKVERKKYGQRGARRRFQFSKR